MNNEKGNMDLNKLVPMASEGSPFTVPDGYFKSLYNQIISRVSKEEDNEIDLDIPKENNESFNIPPNYFDSLANRIQARIEAEEQQEAELNIHGLIKDNPFKVPMEYFDSFEERIKNKLIESEEDPQLNIEGISKEMPFTVPNTYFEHLGFRIDEKISPERARTEFKLATQLFFRRFYKAGVAACLGGIIAIFCMNYYKDHQSSKTAMQANAFVKIDNKNFDVNYFEEDMLVDELLTKSVSVKHSKDSLKVKSLENYIINNVDEDLLLQEL